LYTTSNIIEVIKMKEGEMGGACSMNGSDEKGYKILAGKSEGVRSLR